MKVSEVRLSKGPWGKTQAMASVTFDGQFVVTGLKIVEGSNGLFVSMPSYRDKNGEYKDTAFPLSKDFREEMTEAVLAEFGEVAPVAEGPVGNPKADADPDGLPF